MSRKSMTEADRYDAAMDEQAEADAALDRVFAETVYYKQLPLPAKGSV